MLTPIEIKSIKRINYRWFNNRKMKFDKNEDFFDYVMREKDSIRDMLLDSNKYNEIHIFREMALASSRFERFLKKNNIYEEFSSWLHCSDYYYEQIQKIIKM